jgi:hypothetical protein
VCERSTKPATLDWYDRSEWTASAGLARLLVGGGEIVPGSQGVGVVGTQHGLPVGQGLLVQRDRGPARPAAA